MMVEIEIADDKLQPDLHQNILDHTVFCSADDPLHLRY